MISSVAISQGGLRQDHGNVTQDRSALHVRFVRSEEAPGHAQHVVVVRQNDVRVLKRAVTASKYERRRPAGGVERLNQFRSPIGSFPGRS